MADHAFQSKLDELANATEGDKGPRGGDDTQAPRVRWRSSSPTEVDRVKHDFSQPV